MVRTELTPTHRVIRCGRCPWTARLPRRGAGRAFGTWHGNALATTAKLVGKLNQHIREQHPDELI